MKRKYFSFLAFVVSLLVVACTQQPSVPENEFLIQGELENVPDSAIIVLRVSEGNLLKEVARDTVIGGKFSLKDTISGEAREYCLTSSSKGFPGTWVNVWVAPGKYIRVTGSDKLLKTWNIRSDVLEQQEENNFLKASFPERRQALEYASQVSDLFRSMDLEHAGDKEFRQQVWKQVDSLRRLSAPLDSIILKKELAYLKTAPLSRVWFNHYLVYASFLQWYKKSPDIPEIKALYARLSDADKETEIGKSITEYMNLGPEVNVGDEMVDGDLYDLEGKLRHLAEFKGKYILLDFWSQGCGPCVQGIPELEEVATMYKDRLAVVSISMDDEKSWKEYVAEKKMTGNQWNELKKERTGLAARYKVTGIPHYVLISPEGRVQDMWSGYGPGSLKGRLKGLIK